MTLSKLITPQAMQQCLRFIYTGSIDQRCLELQVRSKTIFINILHFSHIITNFRTCQWYNASIMAKFCYQQTNPRARTMITKKKSELKFAEMLYIGGV